MCNESRRNVCISTRCWKLSIIQIYVKSYHQLSNCLKSVQRYAESKCVNEKCHQVPFVGVYRAQRTLQNKRTPFSVLTAQSVDKRMHLDVLVCQLTYGSIYVNRISEYHAKAKGVASSSRPVSMGMNWMRKRWVPERWLNLSRESSGLTTSASQFGARIKWNTESNKHIFHLCKENLAYLYQTIYWNRFNFLNLCLTSYLLK